jgi:hypothetical protein
MVNEHLRVLTDPEAVLYTEKKSRQGVRRIRAAHREMASIDTARLSGEECSVLDRNLQISARRVTALRGSGRVSITRQIKEREPS